MEVDLALLYFCNLRKGQKEDERVGGTTEQGIRMGPVSVQRVAKEKGGSQAGAATPLHDPG